MYELENDKEYVKKDNRYFFNRTYSDSVKKKEEKNMSIGAVAQFFEDIFDFFVDDVLLLFLALSFFFIMAWIIPKIWTMISRGVYINRPTTKATALFLRILIAFVGIGLSFAALGLDVTQLVTTLGIVGIVVGLGLQQLLALLAAGVIIRSTDCLTEGDTVVSSIGNVEGVVLSVNALYTVICRVDNENVYSIVPNTQWVSSSFQRTRHEFGHVRGLTETELHQARTSIAKIYLARRKQKEQRKGSNGNGVRKRRSPHLYTVDEFDVEE